MSLIRAKAIQMGYDATATNNFLIYQPLTPDGTFRIAVGNQGATTDIMTVTNAGSVTFAGATNFASLNFGSGSQTAPSLAPLGNTNTGVFFPATNTVGITTNGAEAVRVDSTGTLLVGGATAALMSSPKLFTIGSRSTDGLVQLANNVNSGDVNHGILNLVNTATGATGNDARIMFSFRQVGLSTGLDPMASIGAVKEVTDYAAAIQFNTRSSSGVYNEKMRISSVGNVSIGTTSAAYGERLAVYGANLGTTIGSVSRVLNVGGSNGNGSYLETTMLRDSAGADWQTAGTRIQQRIDSTYMAWIQFNGTGNTAGLAFGAGASSASATAVTEKMRISTAGNVAINNTNTNWSKFVVNTPYRGDGGTNATASGAIIAGGSSDTIQHSNTSSTAIFKVHANDQTNNLQFGIGNTAYAYSPWIQGSYDNSTTYGGSSYGATNLVLQPIGGGVVIGDALVQYSSKLYANGSIAARNGGVDGTYADAFIAGYTGNYNEKNIIQSAVSSGSTLSGFRFRVSDGSGLATTTVALDMTRAKSQFYQQVQAPAFVTGDIVMNNTLEHLEPNEVDGTRGHWVLQEGDENLFLINRLTGKKYKFNITEVQ